MYMVKNNMIRCGWGCVPFPEFFNKFLPMSHEKNIDSEKFEGIIGK